MLCVFRYPVSSVCVCSNKINVKILLKLLSRLGWPVPSSSIGGDPAGPCVVALDGLQCLRMLEATLELPDAADRLPQLILMDIAMQGMDGLDCTARIRSVLDARYAALSVSPPYIIACTATISQQNRRQCAAVGMNAFLAKPLSVEALVAEIREADKHTKNNTAKRGAGHRNQHTS